MGDNFSKVQVVRVPLAAVDTGGGIFTWQNPWSDAVIVQRVILDVTTVASAACAVDVGTTVTSAVTVADNLIDGADVHTAVGLFGKDDGDATNAKYQQRLASGGWVTGSKASGASAGIVGNAYIHYIVC